MIARSIEISIVGDVEDIVYIYLSGLFLYILYHVFIVKVQELACSAGYSLMKTLISTTPHLTSS